MASPIHFKSHFSKYFYNQNDARRDNFIKISR
nr:MAG TPA: hypothetical protein [Caudoviricetes sp.]